MTSHVRRVLAAPVLGDRGGGIGRVSELLWRTIQDEWKGSADLLTLLRNGHSHPLPSDKIRFGVALAGRHLWDRPAWIMFSHIGLARAEGLLPVDWRAPYGVFLHGIECWTPLGARLTALVRGAAIRIANSRYTARRAAEANPGIGDIAVCPLALPDLPGAGPGRPRAGREPVVLMVGRMASAERYKGHDALLAAWPGVLARVPTARLVIAGEGDDLARLREGVRGLGLEASVEFTGFLTRLQLEELYETASVFALPSRGEGFGVVYLEAMAHALPCVGSTQDAASEVIVPGDTGLLVNPDDPDEMAREIAGLLDAPERARMMGEAGRARLLDHFTYEQFQRRMIDLLQGAFREGQIEAP